MSKEAISKVRDAEREAEALRERATAEARARMDACEQTCIREKESRLAATAAELKAREATVKSRAEALIERSREEAGGDIDAMREAAEAKMREAIKHIEWEFCDL